MKFITTSLAAAIFVVGGLSGCASMSPTQQITAQGAGLGAAAGALLGGLSSGSSGAAKGAVLGGALGAGGGYLWSQRMAQQKAEMERATAGTGVAVSQTSDNRLKLDIPSDISFATGRSDINSSFAPILNQFATSLNQNPVTTVTIIGHTDTTGSDAINNPLSLDRASSARDYLVSRGVSRNRIMTDGRGSREPIADNNTNDGRSKNRRVEIYVAEPAQASR